MITNIVLNLVLSQSMGALFSMINALQVMITLQSINVRFPANAQMTYMLTRKITECDMLPEEAVEMFYFWELWEDQPEEQEDVSRRRLGRVGELIDKHAAFGRRQL